MILQILSMLFLIVFGLAFCFSKTYWEKMHYSTWIFYFILIIFINEISSITMAILFVMNTIMWIINVIVLATEEKAKIPMFCSIFMTLLTSAMALIRFFKV